MVEAVTGATLQILLEKLLAVIVQEIGPMFGVKNELTKLKKSLTLVQAFLNDACRRNVENEAVKVWLKNLEDVVYEADHLLDVFNYEILRRKVYFENQMIMSNKLHLFFSSSNPVVFRLNMARKIKDVNIKLEIVNKEATNFGLQQIVSDSAIYLPPVIETDSSSVDPVIVGREIDVPALVNVLVNRSNNEVVSVVPIVGMGGLGKTTLARLIFNDMQTTRHFDERIWVCVSENFDITRLLKRILETLTNDVVQIESREAVVTKLQEILKDKRYLLVLDDLWNDRRRYWEEFKSALLGISSNKGGHFCLVTTRSEDVASIVSTNDTYHLDKLSVDDCWSIIKTRAFTGDEVPKALEIIGREIASRCRGLPLAANMVGGTLRGKEVDEWASFLNNGFSASNGEETDVLRVLKVSFDRLPSPLLKMCFAYCSIFPKDAVLEKERLIQLWMAEGFLTENNGNDMENIGSRVHDILLHNFFLQEAVKDEFGHVEHSKMHDLVHDVACLVSEPQKYTVEHYIGNNIPSQVRYLAIKSLGEEAHKILKEGASYLRTLFLGSDTISESMFKDFKNLHILNLQEAQFIELPNSIGKLIQLRFLEVSSRKMKYFPESICNLLNLQTLRATKCFSLTRLPSRFHQLVCLRHLIIWNYQCVQMPPEIGKLICLRTLEFFIVGHEKSFRIEELGYLKHLKGELTIRNLERVSNKEEAARARLVEKTNILKLVFIWSSSMEGNNNHEEVLAGLQPHQYLKSLKIHNFLGNNFPAWTLNMTVGDVFTFNNLIEISLVGCKRCKEIPTLGTLPMLKLLEIDGLKNVKSLGHSFYHSRGHKSSSRPNDRQPPLFRALERFRLTDMTNLVEWIEPWDNGFIAHDAFPNLHVLEIEECRNLAIGPSHDFPSLKELRIRGVDRGSLLLDKICVRSLRSLKIGLVEDFTSLPGRLLYGNKVLESLEIYDCRGLIHLKFPDDAHNFQSLREFSISKCHNLKSIQYSKGELISLRTLIISQCQSLINLPSDMLDSCMSLEMLQISDCDNVSSSFLVDCQRMSSLYCLNISKCAKLRTLPQNLYCLGHLRELLIGPFCKDMCLTSFCDAFQEIRQLHSLRTLSIYGWPQWDSLPHQLQHLTGLTSFRLYDFGIEALPEWFENLSSLQELWLYNCERLRHLPSKEAMQLLTQLSFIWITGCPLLEGINNPNSHLYHSEWCKISNVKHVHVD